MVVGCSRRAAKETDPHVIAATVVKPGVALKRPAGSNGRFAEHADLPDLYKASGPKKSRRPDPKRRAAPKISVKDTREAAAAFEREQKRRHAERLRERQRAHREKQIAKAQAAFDKAQWDHEERAESLDDERARIERRVAAEETRWESERERLREALRRVRE